MDRSIDCAEGKHVTTACRGFSCLPLNAGQDRRHVIRRTPAVLQNIETQLARAVNVGVEHLADEFDLGRLVRVLFLEVHHKAKGTVLKRSVSRTDDDGIPGLQRLASNGDFSLPLLIPLEPYQVMTLSATGDAETPAGGSVCMRC